MKLPQYSAAAALLAALPFSAQALVLTGTSSSYGESINLTFTIGGVTAPITSGPLPSAGGSAPIPYQYGNGAASVSVPVAAIGGSLTTGALFVRGFSSVNGTAGSRTAFGQATGTNLALLLVGNSFTADNSNTFATVSGDFGSLVASGNTSFTNAVFNSGAGGAPVAANPPANTSLFSAPGLSVLVNEQILGGDGITSRSLQVNGFHASFSNYSFGGGTLDGDIIIAHSQASLTAAVPEPATYSMFGAGVAGLLLALRRRRQGTDAA